MKAVIDITLLIIIAMCTWQGYKRGLVGGIASLLAIVVALFGGSLLSSAYSQEVVPALEPFVDGYVDSQANREAVLENLGYAESELSLNDILYQDSSLRPDYAYECLLNVGVFSGNAERLALEAVAVSDESGMNMTDAVVYVICSTATYVAGLTLGFLLILIFLVAVANVGNLSLRLPNMEAVDEIGGAVLGFFRGFVFCVLLSWLLSFLGLVIGRDTMDDSTLGRFFLIFDFITSALM